MRPLSLRLAAAIMAVGVGGAASADVITVNVFDFDFSTGGPADPIADAVINLGDTVRWTFIDPSHTTTSVAGIAEQWDSGFIAPGLSFDHTFNTLGSFQYFCQAHGFDMGNGAAGGMSGTV
ncbi:MAG: hypothetical protein H7Y88_12905, partial [Phycisphaerales bacterium]|nr:hypothetical protein [Phycisphaerales bacterium]